MKDRIVFVYDPTEEMRRDVLKKIKVLLDEDARAKARFMEQFVLSLILTNKRED